MSYPEFRIRSRPNDKRRKETHHDHLSGTAEEEVCQGPSLPDELVIEILYHLPVKSLLRFACVCKSWWRLIKRDTNFALKHSITRSSSSSSTSRLPHPKLMDDIDSFLTCESRPEVAYMYSITPTKELRFLKRFDFTPPSFSMAIKVVCHGIICFVSSMSMWSPASILLCNPLLREVVLVPRLRSLKASGTGFGFDSLNNDYKVVRLACPGYTAGSYRVWAAAVYSVRHRRWLEKPVIAPSLGTFTSLIDTSPVLNANGRICNWLAYKGIHGRGIISFDMVNEVLKEVLVPEYVINNRHTILRLLPSSHYQACLWCSSDGTSSGPMNIWVLPIGKAGSSMWTRLLSVQFPEHEVSIQPSHLWLNDREFLVVLRKDVGVYEVHHYDLSTQQLKQTGRTGFLGPCFGYVESIVSLKGLMSSPCSSHDEVQQCKDGNKEKFSKERLGIEREDTNEPLYSVSVVGASGVEWSYSFDLL